MSAPARKLFHSALPQTPLEIVARELGAAVSVASAAPHGVPSSAKANIAVAQSAASAASASLFTYMSPYSAEAVQRLTAATCNVSCITNMDEFGMGSATKFSVHAECLNPWSPAFHVDSAIRAVRQTSNNTLLRQRRGWVVPGGSSGGAAVSVALGTSALALGSDTGGSVRQPAAFCGVVGFKPTYGAIPRHGLIAYANSLDTIGLLADTVWNATAGYLLTAGWSPKDDTSLRRPHKPVQSAAELSRFLCGAGSTTMHPPSKLFSSALCEEDVLAAVTHTKATLQRGKPLAGLRIGLPVEYAVLSDGPVSIAWEQAAQALRQAGAEVVQVSLPTTSLALASYYVLAPAEAASNLSRYDGVRYGYRAAATDTDAEAAGCSSEAQGKDDNAAAALHELYKRTRSHGFGPEVQRRIMLGNFVLSQSARSAYFDTALMARDAVRADFASIFRPKEGEAEEQPYLGLSHMTNPALYASSASDKGVDVLLTPVTPGLPWCVDRDRTDPAASDPLQEYLQDVMTIPASLAGLPAIAVPTAFSAWSEGQVEDALQDACTAHALTAAEQERVRAALSAKKPSAPVALQIIGRYADEATTLRVAAVLEARSAYQDSLTAHRPW